MVLPIVVGVARALGVASKVTRGGKLSIAAGDLSKLTKVESIARFIRNPTLQVEGAKAAAERELAMAAREAITRNVRAEKSTLATGKRTGTPFKIKANASEVVGEVLDAIGGGASLTQASRSVLLSKATASIGGVTTEGSKAYQIITEAKAESDKVVRAIAKTSHLTQDVVRAAETSVKNINRSIFEDLVKSPVVRRNVSEPEGASANAAKFARSMILKEMGEARRGTKYYGGMQLQVTPGADMNVMVSEVMDRVAEGSTGIQATRAIIMQNMTALTQSGARITGEEYMEALNLSKGFNRELEKLKRNPQMLKSPEYEGEWSKEDVESLVKPVKPKSLFEGLPSAKRATERTPTYLAITKDANFRRNVHKVMSAEYFPPEVRDYFNDIVNNMSPAEIAEFTRKAPHIVKDIFRMSAGGYDNSTGMGEMIAKPTYNRVVKALGGSPEDFERRGFGTADEYRDIVSRFTGRAHHLI